MKQKLPFLFFTFLLLLIVVIASYIFLPQLWFNHKVTARNITFYFDSSHKCLDMPEETIKTQMTQATEYFYKNCFYADSSIKHQIVFYKNPFVRWIASLYTSDHNLGFCLTQLNRSIFIYNVDFCNDGVPPNIPYSGNNLYLYRRNKIITHELVHSNMSAKLGSERYHHLPIWVREGYAEWITHQADDYLCNLSLEQYPYRSYYNEFYNAIQKHNGNIEDLVEGFDKGQ